MSFAVAAWEGARARSARVNGIEGGVREVLAPSNAELIIDGGATAAG
jgi:hypothetical protein